MKFIRLLLVFSILFFSTKLFAKEDGTSLPVSEDATGFYQNVGQVTDQYYKRRKDILYVLHEKGMNIFIGKGAIHYQWNQQDGKDSMIINTYRMDVQLKGANKRARVEEENIQDGYEVYYTNGLKGAISRSCKKLVFKNIYPHTDWVLYLAGNKLKYDFIVHDGGNSNKIKLEYNGADSLYLKAGRLIASTPFGSIEENAPQTYEEATGAPVASSFELKDNMLSIQSALSAGILIDPLLDWVTYYGGENGDGIWGMSTDNLGNVYGVGYTNSTLNIATIGTYQNTFGGGSSDAFLVRFSKFGTRQWATYYGGGGNDQARGVIWNNNKVYMTGITNSSSIATSGSYQSTFAGNVDGFIAKFDTSGLLIWGTYYGGTDADLFYSIDCDSSGNIYASGITKSSQGITTPNSFQSNFLGVTDGMLVKFNSSGQRLWGTYFGSLIGAGSSGGNYYGGYSLAASGYPKLTVQNDKVYLAGSTHDSTNISTAGSYQPNYSDSVDVFLTCFNSQGARLWGTYFGANGYESLQSLCHDDKGNIYISGFTSSTAGIATTGTHQTTIGGVCDGFLAKFDSTGNRIWGTYYGGNAGDYISSVVYKPSTNKVLVGGFTLSANAIATPNAFQPVYASSQVPCSLYAEFDTLGQLYYGTYYGGVLTQLLAMVTDTISNRTYFGGVTQSDTGIATTGAYQTAMQGSIDCFLACLIDTTGSLKSPTIDTVMCAGQTYMVYNDVQFAPFYSNNVFTVQLSDAVGSFANPVNIGTAATPVGGFISCTIPANTPPGNGYRVRVSSSHPAMISINNGYNIQILPIAPAITDTITVSPGNTITSGTTVTFTATVTNGGTSPQYQWRKNGVIIAGATMNTYTTSNLSDSDVIDVIVTSSLPCALQPTDTSNSIMMHVTTSVSQLTSTNNFQIYPNPIRDEFSIASPRDGQLTITTIAGKEIAVYKITKGSNELKFPTQSTSGIYLASFRDIDENTKVFKLLYKP